MRDLMFALMMAIAIPLAIARPINAYLLWGWTAVVVPTSYFYGFMVGARVNFVCAVLTLLLIAFGRVSWSSYQNNRVTWLYLLFLVHSTAVFLFAYPGNPLNAQYYGFLAKGLLFCLVMPFFVRDRLHFHVLMLIVVLGFGLHGVLNGLKIVASGAAHNVQGPSGTMIADRNHLSTALTVALPLVYYLVVHSHLRLMRFGFLGVLVISALTVAGSGSRGAFIALAMVGLWLIFTTRFKLRAFILLGVFGIAFWSLAPDQWFDRLSTIETVGEDESFMGRVIAWKVSSAIAVANPFFGGGFHAVQDQAIWDEFKAAPGLLGFLNLPIPEFSAKAAHSIYFELLGDQGFVGLLIFLAILGQAVYSRWSIKRMMVSLGPSWNWARDMADMLMLSLVAYMTGGAVASLGYFEIYFMVVMIMEMLRLRVKRAVEEAQSVSVAIQGAR